MLMILSCHCCSTLSAQPDVECIKYYLERCLAEADANYQYAKEQNRYESQLWFAGSADAYSRVIIYIKDHLESEDSDQ